MAKKNQKMRKLVEEVEPFEPQAKSTTSGTADAQNEAVPSESNAQDTEEAVEASSELVESSTEIADSSSEEDPAEIPASDQPLPAEQESSEENLLADVRQSLIEEESLEEEKPQKGWRKVGKGRKKEKATKPVPEEEIDLPLTEIPVAAIEKPDETKESAEYLEQIDELIDLLEPAAGAGATVSKVEEEPRVPEEVIHKIDLDELKKQAFQPRETGEEAEISSDVRTIA